MSSKYIQQKFLHSVIFLPLLIAIIFLILPQQKKSNLNLNIESQTQVRKTQKIDPQKLIFLLQYIGADYGGAVEKQKVINSTEFQEMLEFSRAGIAWYQALRPENVGKATFLKLQKLQEIIAAKSNWSEVRQLTNHIIQELSKELNVIPYPKNVLNLSEGQNLYLSACATCHGLNGDGYGPSARDLKPRPNNFQNPTYMNQATPYQFFNAMTFGVTGTAMPSYLQALTEQQRWNIAFYLMTFRIDFNPKRTLQNLKISVKDLAITSNYDLLAQLTTHHHFKGNETFNELAMIDYLRLNPPQMSLIEHLQLAQQKLRKSLASYKNNESGRAIQLTLEVYLDGIEPLEPVFAYSLINSIERELGEYRSAIKFGEPTQVHARYQKLNKLINEIHP
ncbi:MAG: c-type cytochrome, partial [bacterium]